MHVLHNALSDLSSVMTDYDTWSIGAKAVSRYLSERHTKDRLIAVCFATGSAGAQHKNDIDKFNNAIYDKRFDSLMTFVGEILPLRAALVTYWDERALRAGNEQVGSVVVKDVTQAVKSPWWWGYSHVLQCAGAAVFDLGCRLRSCACHPASAFELRGSDNYMKRRRAYEREAATGRPCPMRGCMATKVE